MQKIIHIITDCETIEYNENHLKNDIEKYITDNSKLLISEESFSTGSSLSGRVDRYQIAKRLKSLFPNAKIIIFIREQKSILKSTYLQKIKIDNNFKLQFSEWIDENVNSIHKENIFQYFYYTKLIELYEALFGLKNIKIFYLKSL